MSTELMEVQKPEAGVELMFVRQLPIIEEYKKILAEAEGKEVI